jgi:hypothetical protein
MNKIPDSELILNPDGSVFHLHLLPHQISDTIILVGDPSRVDMVSNNFDRIDYKVQNREFATHTGIFNNKKVTVLSTGIGTDNIDIVINELESLSNDILDLSLDRILCSFRKILIVWSLTCNRNEKLTCSIQKSIGDG